MGKGDQKSRRGKLFKGSYGVRRKKRKTIVPARVEKTIPKPTESNPEPAGGAAAKQDKKPPVARKTTKPKAKATADSSSTGEK